MTAALHRAYRDRAAGIEGQVPGHEIAIGDDYTVIGAGEDVLANVRAVPGGSDVRIGKELLALRHEWRFGEILKRGFCNGVPFALQIERPGLQYRVGHRGARRAATLSQP